MGDTARQQTVSPYARNDSGPTVGSHDLCELCERTTLCFSKHGILACPACHDELLPGHGI